MSLWRPEQTAPRLPLLLADDAFKNCLAARRSHTLLHLTPLLPCLVHCACCPGVPKHTHTQTHTHRPGTWGRGLCLEADSPRFNIAVNGWKKEGRKRKKGGGGNEHSDEGTFQEKSANYAPLMTSFPCQFTIVPVLVATFVCVTCWKTCFCMWVLCLSVLEKSAQVLAGACRLCQKHQLRERVGAFVKYFG